MRRPSIFSLFFFNDTATTEIYTLSLHDALPILIQGDKVAVNPQQAGTKMAALYRLELGAGESVTLKLRLTDMEPLGAMDGNSPMVGAINAPGYAERAEGVPGTNHFAAGFDGVFSRRQKEAADFYA